MKRPTALQLKEPKKTWRQGVLFLDKLGGERVKLGVYPFCPRLQGNLLSICDNMHAFMTHLNGAERAQGVHLSKSSCHFELDGLFL